MNALSVLFDTALEATALLALACAAAYALRRSSAALRHFLWTVALTAALLLPLAQLRPAAPPPPLARTGAIVVTVHPMLQRSAAPAPAPRRPPVWPLYLWTAGCAIVAARFLLGALRASWLAATAGACPEARAETAALAASLGVRRSVRVLASPIARVPMTWGIFRPLILLPADTAAWPSARLTAVLLHELIHIRRRDLAAQFMAQLACSLYWFHPLAWFAAARQRREREAACDDAVLLRGIPAPEYAEHLMHLARAASDAPAVAPAMAEMSNLEFRVRALLDRSRPRSPLSRRAALAFTLAAFACIAPLTLRTARAQPQAGNATLSGTVQDPSGAFIPNARITARNLDGSNEEITTADLAGRFSFQNIPAGHYSIEVSVPGFKRRTIDFNLRPGANAQVNALMAIGNITETVEVVGTRPAAATTSHVSAAPQRIRIGGNVQISKLVRQQRPVYPFDAQQEGVEGTVVIQAIISKTGDTLNAKVVNTSIDSRLAQAALDAVNQWKYQPTLLNGEPVEVLTTIEVHFELN